MDMQTIVMLFVGVAALALAGTTIYAARKPTNVTGVLQATGAALTDIEKAASAANQYVLAAEQLWATGKLPAESRFEFVVDRLEKLFPNMSEETIRDSIEASVAWMKTLEGRLIDEMSAGAEDETS